MSDREDGFEYKTPGDEEATFYRWAVSDGAKDLMLIDRFTKLPVTDFFEVIEDDFELRRGPILLALIATAMRARHPDWSVERVARTVDGLSLSEVTFIDSGETDESVPQSGGRKGPPARTST